MCCKRRRRLKECEYEMQEWSLKCLAQVHCSIHTINGQSCMLWQAGREAHHNVNCIHLVFLKLRVIYPHLWCYLRSETRWFEHI